jgi:hypothetical protein
MTNLRIENLKDKTVGILSDEEFDALAKYRYLTNKDGGIIERNFKSFEKDIDQLIDKYTKFNMVPFDIDYLRKILDYEIDEVNVILKETDYGEGIQNKYKIIFEKDSRFYKFYYRMDSFGSESIGGLCNDIDCRLNKYICYEVERKETPIITTQYLNLKKNDEKPFTMSAFSLKELREKVKPILCKGCIENCSKIDSTCLKHKVVVTKEYYEFHVEEDYSALIKFCEDNGIDWPEMTSMI